MQDNILTHTVLPNKKELAKKIKLILSNIALSMLSGLLLAYAYPPYNFSFLAFFSIIILLIINELACKINLELRYTFLLFWLSGVVTNIIVTHWLYHTVIIPVLLIHCINPIFIAFALTVYSKVYRKFSPKIAYCALTLLWICFEYLHHHWQLSYPFLTLGNTLAGFPELIQWYSYVGVLGGSLWILLVSIGLYETISSPLSPPQKGGLRGQFLQVVYLFCLF